jgi:hypothetical protein
MFRTLIFAGGGCFGFSYTYIVFLGLFVLEWVFATMGFLSLSLLIFFYYMYLLFLHCSYETLLQRFINSVKIGASSEVAQAARALGMFLEGFFMFFLLSLALFTSLEGSHQVES